MLILTLDLGQHLGWASGPTGAAPASGSVDLQGPRRVSCGNLMVWLNDNLRLRRPELVVTAKPLSLQTFKYLNSASDTVRMTLALHGILEGMCVRHGVRCEEVAEGTIRKHFIGRGNAGNRAATKAAVVKRCQLLGYMPRNSFDDNRADACATWDFGQAHFARATGGKLVLFEAVA